MGFQPGDLPSLDDFVNLYLHCAAAMSSAAHFAHCIMVPTTSADPPAIRPAAAEESALLSALAMRSKAYWGYTAAFMEACRAELTYGVEYIDHNPVFVLESGGEVVGFYAFSRRSRTEAELEALFVEPAHIGRGFGRALIEHAKERARALGCSTLVIQGDPHAAAFYRAAGGENCGTRESGSISGRMLPLFRITLTTPE